MRLGLLMRLRKSNDAFVEWSENRASIRVGDKKLFFHNYSDLKIVTDNADFAAYALAALAFSWRVPITLHAPVTRSAERNLVALNKALSEWGPHKETHWLTLPNIIEDPQPHLAGGIQCLSGGIDSTYAALKAAEDGYTHALFVAGADYPGVESPGFKAMHERVAQIASTLRLSLAVVETDIRALGIKWELMHRLVLAACLHFVGSGRMKAAIAADFPAWHENYIVPWGNCWPIVQYFGSHLMPVEHRGRDVGRTEKIRSVFAAHPEFGSLVSVCYKSAEFADNCGTCRKCLRQRAAMVALGVPVDGIFLEMPALEEALEAVDISSNPHSNISPYLLDLDLYSSIPPSPPINEIFRRRLEKRYPSLPKQVQRDLAETHRRAVDVA